MISRSFRKIKTLAAAAGLVLVAGACGEVSGVGDGMGSVQVTLQEATAEALFQVVAADFAAAPEETAGRVPRQAVELLQVTVTGIQILPYCEDAEEENGDGQCEDLWETLDLEGNTYKLNLLALPSEEEDAVVLAEGTVPAGEYHKIRLFVSDAIVAFGEEISVGQSSFAAFDSGEGYVVDDTTTWFVHPLEIPSAQNTGIKADIDLMVEDTDPDPDPDPDADPEPVELLFDADATFKNVIATGSGRVKMPPVLKVRPMNQNQNQNGG